jgi:hypothetical protein
MPSGPGEGSGAAHCIGGEGLLRVPYGRAEAEGRPEGAHAARDLGRTGGVRALTTVTLGPRLDLGEAEVHQV